MACQRSKFSKVRGREWSIMIYVNLFQSLLYIPPFFCRRNKLRWKKLLFITLYSPSNQRSWGGYRKAGEAAGACVATPTGQVFKWHFPQWSPGFTVPALWRGAMIQRMGWKRMAVWYSNSSMVLALSGWISQDFYQSLNWHVGPFWQDTPIPKLQNLG